MATLNAGSGADGNATVSADTNLSTESLVGRGYADMALFQCSSVGSSSCVASATPDGIAAGDEVLLINWQGISGDTANVGNYETFIVDNVNTNTITFTTSKTKNYGNTGGDTNIGTGGSNQRVIVQRVPQYNNLTIDNGFTLTADGTWDQIGGILFLRAAGTILVNGSIDMTGKGYTGGYNNFSGTWYMRTGAGINGGPRSAAKTTSTWHTTSNLGGGGRGGWYTGSDWCGGHGGGYGTAGGVGTRAGNGAASGGAGGTTYGEQTLSKLFMGSGGGSSIEPGTESGDTKSDGGGILALFTTTLDIYGSILCRGQNGTGDASSVDGGGSGGSILIHAGTIYTRSSTFDATGIVGRTGNQVAKGGDGGDGRIAITYASLGDSLASVDPAPYTDDTLELPYAIEGTLSEACTLRVYDSSWGFIKSQAASAGSYQISNLPNPGPFFVIADPDGAARNILGYKGVIPTQ